MLTERKQQQAIRDRQAGLQNGFDPSHLTPPYDYLWQTIADSKDSYEAEQQLYRLKHFSDERLTEIIDTIMALEAGYKNQYQTLADIRPTLRSTSFLWENWLPYGYPSALVGWPGVGKSYIALSLAHLLISNQAAPDGQPFKRRTGRVIFVDAEDLLNELNERAEVWGLDPNMFYPVRRPPRRLLDLGDPIYQDDLHDMCHDLRPDLVIIDSFSQANSRGEGLEDVRDIMLFLDELPKQHNCGELMIYHPRKPPAGSLAQPITQHDLRGSGLILAVSRAILGVDLLKNGPDDNPNGPRRLKMLKTNFGPCPLPITVKFTPSTNPRIAFVSYSQNDYFVETPNSLIEECARWLMEVLADEPETYARLRTLALELGYSETILQRGRKKLGDQIIDTVGPRRKGNKWALVKKVEENEPDELT